MSRTAQFWFRNEDTQESWRFTLHDESVDELLERSEGEMSGVDIFELVREIADKEAHDGS